MTTHSTQSAEEELPVVRAGMAPRADLSEI